MIKSREELLKKYLITEGKDILLYNTLNEDQKNMFTKEIVAEIVKSIEDKEYALDNQIINKSKGDITNLENYRYIKSSLELLSNMQASFDEKIPYLDVIIDARKNLEDNVKDFSRGYALNKSVVKLLYSNLVLALIQSLSFLISVSIDYIKDPLGNYQANIRYNLKKNNNYPTINFESLAEFNLMAKNGELNHFFNRIYTDKNLQEDLSVFVDGLIDVFDTAVDIIGTTGSVLFGLAKLIPTIPDLLRMLVSMSLYTRVAVSDYLRLQAYYLELNTERLKNIKSPNKKSIKKQEKIMKDLIKLADKIDIDQKMANKKAKIEIEEQNKNISKSIKNNTNISGISVSVPNSLPHTNTVEEIIL